MTGRLAPVLVVLTGQILNHLAEAALRIVELGDQSVSVWPVTLVPCAALKCGASPYVSILIESVFLGGVRRCVIAHDALLVGHSIAPPRVLGPARVRPHRRTMSLFGYMFFIHVLLYSLRFMHDWTL